MKKIKPIFKCQRGSQFSDWIISLLPENHQNMTYLEPYCGSAKTLMHKQPSIEEVINDSDETIIRILRAIRCCYKEFTDRLKKIKYCRDQFLFAKKCEHFVDDFDAAINELILRRMSRGGLKKAFAQGQNGWASLLDTIPVMSERLEKVYIFSKPAIDVLKAFNRQDTIAYISPTDEEREKIQAYLPSFRGKFIFSGPPCLELNEFRHEKKKSGNHTEHVWMNYS